MLFQPLSFSMVRRLLGVAAALALTSCEGPGGSPAPALTPSPVLSQGIIGGKAGPKNPALQGAVALRFKNADRVPHCSGALIADRVVLTAAHCLYDEGSKVRPQELEIVFGPNGRAAQKALLRNVKELRIHPGYLNIEDPCPFGDCDPLDDYLNHNPADIALLWLDTKAPAAIPRLAFNESGERLHEGLTALAAGHGLSKPLSEQGEEDPEQSLGALQAAEGEITLDIGGANSLTDYGKLYFKATARTSVCHGDSGGPLLQIEKNQARVLGVLSHLAVNDDTYPCGGRYGAYTDVSTYSLWVRRVTDELGRLK